MLITIEHECDDGLLLQLTFEYTKGYDEVRYLRNGDPGYPGEPDAVDLIDVQILGANKELLGEPWKTWPEKWGKWMEDNYEEEVIDAVTGDDDRETEAVERFRGIE